MGLFFLHRLNATYDSELTEIISNTEHRKTLLKAASSEKTALSVVKDYVEFYNAHDILKLSQLYAAHCVSFQAALSKEIRGKEAIISAYREAFRTHSNLRCEVKQMYSSGTDIIVLEWEGWYNVQKGLDSRDEESNESLKGCTIFNIQNGMILEQREYWDKLNWKKHQGIDYESRPSWKFAFGVGMVSLGVGYFLLPELKNTIILPLYE